MKQTYSTPILTTHGNVGSITQAFGNRNLTDFVFFNGAQIPDPDGNNDGGTNGLGSRDGIINPV
ncbi:MAG: lasso peptide [Hassallia sp.]